MISRQNGRPLGRVSRPAVSAAVVALAVVGFAGFADGSRHDRRHRRRTAKAVEDLVWVAIDVGGTPRSFAVYRPETLGAAPAPLVFVLHGGGRSATDIWTEEYGWTWRDLADDNGIVLVLPEGRPDPSDSEDHHWNDCRAGIRNVDADSSEDDVAFITAVIDWMSDRYPIDAARVYATGASNGGMMTYRLADEAGSRFAAMAAIIANLPDPSECTGAPPPIPMLIMNGTDDPLMPWDGGCVGVAGCPQSSVLSTADTVAFWRSVNGTGSDPAVTEVPDSAADDHSTVTVFTYGGDTPWPVVLYEVDGGGHTVPGPTQLTPLQRLIFGWKNQDINGPVEIWDFLSRHSRDPAPRQPAGRSGP